MKYLIAFCALTLAACAASAENEGAKQADTQKAALKLGERDDLPAIASADRAEIKVAEGTVDTTLRKKVSITDKDDLKKIKTLLTIKETPPSAGEMSYTVLFYKNGTLLREVWVYPNGEWGVVRTGSPSWVLGINAELHKTLHDFLKPPAPAAAPDK